jgi:hypothetical protein
VRIMPETSLRMIRDGYKRGHSAGGAPVSASLLPLDVQTPRVAELPWEQRSKYRACEYPGEGHNASRHFRRGGGARGG